MNRPSLRRILKSIGGMLLLLFLSHTAALAEDRLTASEADRKPGSMADRIKILENPLKEKQKQPERVLDTLGVKAGDIVADVGAGTGFFAFRLAPRVGPAGKVYAVEIEDRLLAFMRDKAEKDGVKNIVLVKSSAGDPHLPPASCDKIVLAGVYNYLADPVAFMARLGKALKPGGVLAIIDLDPGKIKEAGAKKLYRPGEIADTMKRAGFALRASHDFLANRFFLVFAAGE